MGRNQPDIGNRFFKIMMPGCYEQKLKVPPTFCKKLKAEKSTRAILEGCKGKFTIGVSRNRRDHQILFEDGWPRFVAENGLSIGDCLVFEHTQELHFNVVVFGSSTMEKHFLDQPNNHHQQCCRDHRQNGKGKAHEKAAAPLDSQTPPHFTAKMTPYTATKIGKVCIPMAFARSINLGQKRSVTLRVGRKRSWAVKLQVQEAYGMRPFLSRGWHHFYTSNDLRIGDVCVFELDPTSLASTPLFDVNILRNAEFLG